MAQGDADRIARAKQQAVSRFLPEAAPAPEFTALAVRTAHHSNVVGVGVGPKVKKGRVTSRTSDCSARPSLTKMLFTLMPVDLVKASMRGWISPGSRVVYRLTVCAETTPAVSCVRMSCRVVPPRYSITM